MKNTIKFLAIVLVAFTFQSCSKDKVSLDDNPTEDAYYKVYVDGVLKSEASVEGSSIINGSITTGNQTDFVLEILNLPEIGQTVEVDYQAWAVALDNDDASLPMVRIFGETVNGTNNDAYMFSGTITRVSKYKVTFIGIYKELIMEGASHDFNGEVVVELVINI